MYTIDTDTVGDFTVTTYYDETAENPQHWYDHATVIIPFDRHSGWKRSTLADHVPATYRRPDGATVQLAHLDVHRFTDYDDPATDFADWCTEMADAFGPNVYVAFVAYEDYGSNGARVYLGSDPMPLLDTEATWQAIVDPDSGWTADGCIVISPLTAPGTDIDAYADIVRGDCAELTAYLSGDCYYWTVTDATTGDVVDACGGYVGGYDDMLAEARHTAGWYDDQRRAALTWLRAEAEWRMTIPDVTTVLAAQRTLWALDELAVPAPA